MNHSESVDFFAKQGIKADVDDTGDYAITVSTEQTVPDSVKFAFEFVAPAGVRIHYVIKGKKVPIPSTLFKWYKDTSKEMK